MVDFDKLSRQVKKFVISYYESHPDSRYTYHNLLHTRNVVAAVRQIAEHYQLSDADCFAVVTAAWFHDTGYATEPAFHEEKSVVLAMDFLRGFDLDDAIQKNVADCIMATKMPQAPEGILQSIICDADLFHLGTDDFAPKSKLMRQEINNLQDQELSKNDWRVKSIALMEAHQYHTDYCRLLLNDGKEKNLQVMKAKADKRSDKNQQQQPAPAAEVKPVDDTLIFPVDGSEQKLSKGVETMFRLTSGNHQRLSNMADSKAHIMISVNAIIISLLISLLLRNIEAHQNLMIPAIMLLMVSLITIVFSILATRPNITQGTFTAENIKEQDVNLLFFGNFYKMELPEYKAGMIAMIKNNEFLYNSLITDVYAQGVVLGRKYRLLRAAYNVFMFGLVISVIAFIISAFY